MKRAPTFWWDFDPEGNVIVQGDYPGGERLAEFPVVKGRQSMELQIAQAEALIADYRAGRQTPPWKKP